MGKKSERDALVIRVDGSVEVIKNIPTNQGLKPLYKAIGCDIVQGVQLSSGVIRSLEEKYKVTLVRSAQMWLDEEGHLNEKQFNANASALTGNVHYIVGDAIIVAI
jgi:hypothetical protein